MEDQPNADAQRLQSQSYLLPEFLEKVKWHPPSLPLRQSSLACLSAIAPRGVKCCGQHYSFR
jgi:hypothetical protein